MVGPPKPMMMPDMAPMMPFDMNRFDGPGMMPPMFPFQLPPMGMPGIPIPPPPAPQPMAPESEDYQIEMAAMADEFMQQGIYGQAPVGPPFAPPTQHIPPPPTPPMTPETTEDTSEIPDPYMAAEIAAIMHTLTTAQLTHTLAVFKIFYKKSPISAKRLLINNPQLVYALIHAQYILGNTDKTFLKLSTADQHMARLNRKERMAMNPEHKGSMETVEDDDLEEQTGKHRRTTDETEEPCAPQVEHQRPEPSRAEPGNTAAQPRRKESKMKDISGTGIPRKVAKVHKESDVKTAEAPVMVPYDHGPQHHVPAPSPYVAPMMGVHHQVPPHPPPSHRPPPPVYTAQPHSHRGPVPPAPMAPVGHPPMHVAEAPPPPIHPPQGVLHGVIAEGTIEDLLKEVQPAPPILVEEVLKHTEILTNIQRATLAEMQSWPPEQRLQVMSIKLALHHRGISINL
ncbi:RNA recognition motif domain containing protein, putative [Babesia ovis]|uniref:RNA recognition motif domain containing protein, putative n=1 Tax=Babesia ovis TaxID=5869 RepID=A0A9W5WVD1_BABOV|nr:RNA recognition motif domain containing protein, putative [Babesia ovis]